MPLFFVIIIVKKEKRKNIGNKKANANVRRCINAASIFMISN